MGGVQLRYKCRRHKVVFSYIFDVTNVKAKVVSVVKM